MKNYFICTANEEHEILEIEAVFEDEVKAAQWCRDKNASDIFGTYTYSVVSMRVSDQSEVIVVGTVLTAAVILLAVIFIHNINDSNDKFQKEVSYMKIKISPGNIKIKDVICCQ